MLPLEEMDEFPRSRLRGKNDLEASQKHNITRYNETRKPIKSLQESDMHSRLVKLKIIFPGGAEDENGEKQDLVCYGSGQIMNLTLADGKLSEIVDEFSREKGWMAGCMVYLDMSGETEFTVAKKVETFKVYDKFLMDPRDVSGYDYAIAAIDISSEEVSHNTLDHRYNTLPSIDSKLNAGHQIRRKNARLQLTIPDEEAMFVYRLESRFKTMAQCNVIEYSNFMALPHQRYDLSEATTISQCGLDSIYPDAIPELDTSISILSIFIWWGVLLLILRLIYRAVLRCDCVWQCCGKCFDICCCCCKRSGLYLLTLYTILTCMPLMFYFDVNFGWTGWFPAAIEFLFMLPLIGGIFYGWCIVRWRRVEKHECTILVGRSPMLKELKQRSDESAEKSTSPDYSDDDDATIQPYDRGPDSGCKKPTPQGLPMASSPSSGSAAPECEEQDSEASEELGQEPSWCPVDFEEDYLKGCDLDKERSDGDMEQMGNMRITYGLSETLMHIANQDITRNWFKIGCTLGETSKTAIHLLHILNAGIAHKFVMMIQYSRKICWRTVDSASLWPSMLLDSLTKEGIVLELGLEEDESTWNISTRECCHCYSQKRALNGVMMFVGALTLCSVLWKAGLHFAVILFMLPLIGVVLHGWCIARGPQIYRWLRRVEKPENTIPDVKQYGPTSTELTLCATNFGVNSDSWTVPNARKWGILITTLMQWTRNHIISGNFHGASLLEIKDFRKMKNHGAPTEMLRKKKAFQKDEELQQRDARFEKPLGRVFKDIARWGWFLL